MSFPILSVMIALPLLAALGCLFLKADGARWLALGATLALFVLGCVLWAGYDVGGAQYVRRGRPASHALVS